MTTAFATCDLCDVHEDDASGAFRGLPPVFRDFGAPGPFSEAVATLRRVEDNSLVREAVKRDLAVEIQGVAVRPGDWLYAGGDGIVVSATSLT